MKISDELSFKVKNMSLLCAAFVVTIHILLPGGRESSTWFASQFIVKGLAQIAVPFFFLVSGYFLAAHIGEDNWWRKALSKRFFSLVIPFFIWSFISTVVVIPLNVCADLIAHRPFGTSIYLLHGVEWCRFFGIDMTDYPELVPLWYVRCLFIFVIASPVVAFCLSKLGWLWLFVCFVASILCCHISNPALYNLFCRGISADGLFYFSAGIFIRGQTKLSDTTFAAITSLIVGIGFLSLKIVLFYNSFGWQGDIGKLSVPFLLYAIWHWMPAVRLPRWLADCSFPIFLMHVLFFPYLTMALKSLHVEDNGLMHSLLRFAVGFVGSIVVANLMRMSFPKISKALFGGR